jgi:hypothetical protein
MDPATSELLKLGLPGVVILGLAAAVIVLWRKVNDERTNNAALQESRLTDTRKGTEALVNASIAMSTMREAVQQLDESLRTMMAESQARTRSRER